MIMSQVSALKDPGEGSLAVGKKIKCNNTLTFKMSDIRLF